MVDNLTDISLTDSEIDAVKILIRSFKQELKHKFKMLSFEISDIKIKIFQYLNSINLLEKHPRFEAEVFSHQEIKELETNIDEFINELGDILKLKDEMKNILTRMEGR